MDLTKELVNALSSTGNQVYQVLFNYVPIKIEKKNLQVKLITANDKTVPVFGVFVNVDRRNELSYIDNFISFLEDSLMDKNLAGIDFSSLPIGNDFIIQVNTSFRLINIVQAHFQNLCEIIYVNNEQGDLSLGDFVLGAREKQILFDYFENLIAKSYIDLLESKISRGLSKNYSIMFLNSLEQYLPIFFSGPCLINPLTQCGKYSRIIKETQLYKLASQHVINIESNTVSMVTNREICECLGLTRFVPYNSAFLVYLLLGMFNPKTFPNKDVFKYVTPEGKVFTEETILASGVPIENTTRASGLFVLVNQYRRKLRITDVALYFEIVSDARLI